jgi:predicted NBD/HSP70 family sugar kinase
LLVGIDVGEKRITALLADSKAKVFDRREAEKSGWSVKSLEGDCSRIVKDLIEKTKASQDVIKSIGVGVTGKRYMSIGKRLDKNFRIKTFVEDNAYCAALAERRLNPKAATGDLLYIYSSLGSGVAFKKDAIISGKDEDKYPDKARYLKSWSETMGITQMARQEVARGVGTLIVDLSKADAVNITEDIVVEAAVQNDEVASNILKFIGLNLGLRVAYLVNLFEPDLVILGGSLERAGEFILEPIRKTVGKWASHSKAAAVKIAPSVLGPDAVGLGAAYLAK